MEFTNLEMNSANLEMNSAYLEMNSANLEMNSAYLEMMNRIARVFPSEPSFANAKKYMFGLLSPIERKNGWQMAEAVGEATPYSIQQFLYRGKYSADKLRDHLRDYVNDKLGDEDGVMVVDETGFLKQGKMSCGVKRQYSGTAGRIENCQIGVFLTYASAKGHAPIDRRLYVPEDWFEDPERCRKAGIPQTVTFQTKPQMALEMIQSATAAGVSYRWVTGDCVYGDYRTIRLWLEEQRKCYVLCVSGKEHVWSGINQVRVSNINELHPQQRLRGITARSAIRITQQSCGELNPRAFEPGKTLQKHRLKIFLLTGGSKPVAAMVQKAPVSMIGRLSRSILRPKDLCVACLSEEAKPIRKMCGHISASPPRGHLLRNLYK